MRQRHPDCWAWETPQLHCPAARSSKAENWYGLAVIGKSRVVDVPAVIVLLTPRDQHRYGFELHLDKETGLPLKVIAAERQGAVAGALPVHADWIPPMFHPTKICWPGSDCKAITLDSDKALASQDRPGLAFRLVAARLRTDQQYLTQGSGDQNPGQQPDVRRWAGAFFGVPGTAQWRDRHRHPYSVGANRCVFPGA